MSNIFRYDKSYESELIELLKAEPDWSSFISADALNKFKNALLVVKPTFTKAKVRFVVISAL